jgi:hypothetical protein
MRLAHSFALFWATAVNIIDIGSVLKLSTVVFTWTSLAALGEFEMPRAQRFDCGGEAC